MNKRSFDYKPLACNKNDREFRWDVKRDKDIPEDAVPKKYRIAGGTMLPAGGYMVFDETHFTPTP